MSLDLLAPAIAAAFRKLSPRQQFRNPVMFIVFVCSVLTTGLWVQALAGHGEAPAGFILWVAIWLWFTLLFANFAEAIAEGRGKAQAKALRGARRDVVAHKLAAPERRDAVTFVSASDLRKGDIVLVEAGEAVPGDGEVIDGAASVDESAITGESAPVIRESGGDPQFRHRRYARAVRLDRRAHRHESRRELSRSHDRDGGRRQPAQDSKRDRADDPAREVQPDLPARLRDAVAVLVVCGE